MTTRHEKAKAEAERLLALRQRHKDSNWTCLNGHKPMTLRDPLARILVAEPGEDDICPECRQRLESLGQVENEDFIRMWLPRGIDPEDST